VCRILGALALAHAVATSEWPWKRFHVNARKKETIDPSFELPDGSCQARAVLPRGYRLAMLERACRRAIDWVAPGENPSGVIYGVIVIAALLAAESGSHESYLDTVGSALIAACLYWFAHAYASLLGRRLTTQERLTAGGLWGSLSHDWALVRGATIPLLALVCGWIAGAAQQTSVTAALWTCVVWLIALELVAGVRSRASTGELALQTGAGAAMGLAILALKVLLHH